MDLILSLLPMIVLFAVMYFLMIRPQKKQADKKREMLDAMKRGDGVVTIGGLHGIIDEVNHADRTVVLDCEGIYLTFELSAIASVKVSTPTSEETIEVLEEDYANSDELAEEGN
ncbi:preprotein translocase subunit YajC [Aerococcaceae bacterium DSM 109653]|uniref:Preprotein translocase subunit YajC n=1 Tax=Fundicoccus ignavus TaxID=2664442 RepID=A0A6I2GHB7_9LACT|nr:preprotein translocase subunit YajC [Fundicoccus ignavus]MRI80657.1 preprotein translocase subunit YajC [Fundicoccus ignavus]MRI84891.1 preprotein translocase subunit YajC [Fundicoccus ignavus]